MAFWSWLSKGPQPRRSRGSVLNTGYWRGRKFMKNTLFPQYTNHIGFVIDASGSMRGRKDKTIEVFEAQIQELKSESVRLNQDTRVSVFMFSDDVKCAVFDMDVMRFEGLRSLPWAFQSTALLDAVGGAISDMEAIHQKYGDHSFLVYTLTDGEENVSKKWNKHALSSTLANLPENWTVVCLVPDSRGVSYAQECGFIRENIQVWSTTSAKGLEAVQQSTTTALKTYMTMRSRGVRGTKSFFATDLSGVSKTTVTKSTNVLPPASYDLFENRGKSIMEIKAFVESWRGAAQYVIGSAYYELMKPEKIQGAKNILLQERKTGKVYEGAASRQLLGLPAHEIKVTPGDHGDWRIFVQSTSVNRHVVPGMHVLVMK